MTPGATQSSQMQQLLEQMHDIQAPPPLSWWPPAPGWWVLAALVLILLAVLVAWVLHRRASNAYRRAALGEVAQLHSCAPQMLLPQVNSLLKRTALHAYMPMQRQINGAFGPGWVDWLNARCKSPVFTGAAAEQLAGGGYSPNEPCDPPVLIAAVQRWIQNHRPAGRQRHV
jgi:hypothetical protein